MTTDSAPKTGSPTTLFPSALRAAFLGAMIDGTRSVVELDDGWFCFETPFLNRVNDAVCIYAKNDGGIIRFSDDGESLALFVLGGKTVADAKTVASIFGVVVDEQECAVVAESGAEDAGKTFVLFLNAVLALSLAGS